ncbi:MAG: hypothetical protein LBI20_04230 [Holosporales bacterium]|jgi:hypothetical protein|nr:hypothetical protein [Holosporales bacterium]
MKKFQLNFYNSNEHFVTTDILDISISESENEMPKCIIAVPAKILEITEKFSNCDVLWGDLLLFKGNLISFSLVSNCEILQISLQIAYDPGRSGEKNIDSHRDLLEKFRTENPEVLIPLTINQVSRTGDIRPSSFVVVESVADDSINLDHKILRDSFKMINHGAKSIGNIDLEISASWVARREGDLEISSRIANRFSAGKVNTLTPKKLNHSWPCFGDRIAHHQNARATKYFIGRSRLERDDSMTTYTPEISIAEDIPRFRLRREFFDNKLTVSWGFDQFVTETVRTNIRKSIDKSFSKQMKINLHNVQEYIDDQTIPSFFSTDIGISILEEIFSGIGNYLVLSMRNIEFSFEVPFDEETVQIGCDSWIKIQNRMAKVTGMNIEISKSKKIIKITAAAFANYEKVRQKVAEQSMLRPSQIPRPNEADFGVADVLQDIRIQNDAEMQFRKLMAYIEDLKRIGKINKCNYKSLISSFLSENQTTITIIAKPLKTKHHEKRFIEVEEPLIF